MTKYDLKLYDINNFKVWDIIGTNKGWYIAVKVDEEATYFKVYSFWCRCLRAFRCLFYASSVHRIKLM